MTLQASSATFTGVAMRVSGEGGGVTDPLKATLLTQGTNIFAGQITVHPYAGSLTIDAESMGDVRGNLTLEASGSSSAAGGLLYVTQESALHLKGQPSGAARTTRQRSSVPQRLHRPGTP